MSDYYILTTDNSKFTPGPLRTPDHVDVDLATPAQRARAKRVWQKVADPLPYLLPIAKRKKINGFRQKIKDAISEGVQVGAYTAPVWDNDFRTLLKEHLADGGEKLYEVVETASGEWVMVAVTHTQAQNFWNTYKTKWRDVLTKMKQKQDEINACNTLECLEAITWNG